MSGETVQYIIENKIADNLAKAALIPLTFLFVQRLPKFLKNRFRGKEMLQAQHNIIATLSRPMRALIRFLGFRIDSGLVSTHQYLLK